jgi:hypothetical protein
MQLRIELQHNSESENFYARFCNEKLLRFKAFPCILKLTNITIVIDETGF